MRQKRRPLAVTVAIMASLVSLALSLAVFIAIFIYPGWRVLSGGGPWTFPLRLPRDAPRNDANGAGSEAPADGQLGKSRLLGFPFLMKLAKKACMASETL